MKLRGREDSGLEAILRKSFEFNVTIESALPSLGQRQKESCLGPGEISIEKWSLTSSARSRIRLTTRPIRCGRTRRRFRTSFVLIPNIFGIEPGKIVFLGPLVKYIGT
jgi:hypothetical protein